MKKNTHYAKPGADDSFLRPELDSQWSAREITVVEAEGQLLLGWVHRHPNQDYPVICSGGKLRILAEQQRSYSKLAFINPRSVAFYAGDGVRPMTLNIIDAEHRTALPTPAKAAYELDALELPDGTRFIAANEFIAGRSGSSIGLWRDNERLRLPVPAGVSLNRPRLVAGSGQVRLICDGYWEKKFALVEFLLTAAEPSEMRIIARDDGWNLFPATTVGADGRIWLSWLRQETVSRDDCAGWRARPQVAVCENGHWRDITVDIPGFNLGLLPVERYFGYDGLRRRPRLAAMLDGSVYLVWEQQKHEQELWENLANGFLLAKRLDRPGEILVLAQQHCCFAFAEKMLHDSKAFRFAGKSEHRTDGADFVAMCADLRRAPQFQLPEAVDFSNWQRDDYQSRLLMPCRRYRQWQLFWGDLHCHSIHSPDAEGAADELFAYARDIAKLDFVAITDNDFYPNKTLLDSEIDYLAAAAEAFTSPEFVAMSGYEWTYHEDDADRSFNHRIVIYPRGARMTARRNETTGSEAEDFAQYLQQSGYFCFPHHGYWRLLGAEPAVEVNSAWGLYIRDAETVFANLNAGKRFAFLGNSDSHRFLPGLSGALTGVFASECSQEAILDAIRARRCFSTTGNRTAVVFTVNDAFIGETATGSSSPEIRWQAFAERPIEYIAIIRDGVVVHHTDRTDGVWHDRAVAPGHHWYLLELKEAGEYVRHPHNLAPAWGKYLWTSPIWLTT